MPIECKEQVEKAQLALEKEKKLLSDAIKNLKVIEDEWKAKQKHLTIFKVKEENHE